MKENLIKNVDLYDATKLSNKVLADDLRIVVAWYSILKSGKSIKYSKEQILNLAEKIISEMVKRGFKFHFETSSDAFRELARLVFEKIASEKEKPYSVVKKDGIFYAVDEDGNKLFELNSCYDFSGSDVCLLPPNQVIKLSNNEYRVFGRKIEFVEDLMFVNGCAYKVFNGLKYDLDDFEVEFNNSQVLVNGVNIDEFNGFPKTYYAELEKLLKEELRSRTTASDVFDVLTSSGDVVLVNDAVSIVGSSVTSNKPNDVDILIRLEPTKENAKNLIDSIIIQIRKLLEDLNLMFHPIANASGAHATYVPVFDLVLRPKSKFNLVEIQTQSAMTFRFTPIKTKGGYGEYTFSTSKDGLDALYQTFAVGFFENNIPLVVEKKYDGFRCIIRVENGKVKITSEDTDKPLNDYLPKEFVKEFEKIKDSVILDGELELYAEEDVQGMLNFDYKKGDKIERIDMKSFLSKKPAGKFSAVYNVFDIVYFNEPINELPYVERRKILHKVISNLDSKIVKKVEMFIVKNKKELLDAIKKVSKMKYSEGAMIKSLLFKYNLSGKSGEIAKAKNYKELVVKVEKVEKTKSEAYIYTCSLADGTVIGKTYATKLKLNKGDILEVRVAEVKYENGKLSWDNPIPHSKKPDGTALTTKEQAILLSRLKRGFEILEKSDDSETRSEAAEKFWSQNWHKFYPKKLNNLKFVIQHHYRGLVEAEINSQTYTAEADILVNDDCIILGINKEFCHLLETNSKAFITKIGGVPIEELKSEKDLLKKAKVSVHSDLRFETDSTTLHGWTLFENAKEIKEYGDALMKKNYKVQCHPKLAQPYAWLLVGVKKPYVAEPGGVGSTSKKYAKFFAFDTGTYEPMTWHRSFFEYKINGSKVKGRFVVQKAEIDGKRIWLCFMSSDEKYYAETHDLEKVKSELKSRGHSLLIWRPPSESPKFIKL